jgi:CheY-like chemotaxis protein
LRTPINAILGYSEMLLEDAEDQGTSGVGLPLGTGAAAIPDLQRIHAAGTELLGLVNDILDPARIEAGSLDIDLEEVGANLRYSMLTPISAIVGYSEMLLEEDEAGSEGEMSGVPSGPRTPGFRNDVAKIHSAARRFLDLINDVVAFARLQGVDVTATALGEGATAMGMSTFAALSVNSAGAVSTVQFLAEEEPEALHGEHGTILVVDDNDINREVLARRLERQGHALALAASGQEALELVRAGKFDLVLLDVMMPEMNGYQVLQYMKADQVLRDIPVIMISALDEIDSVALCIEMGAEDYLPKPFNPVLLRARIDASLEKKRLRNQEVEYIRNAERVTAAAAAVEAGEFQPESLDEVAARSDALGGLARVFQRMAVEVRSREERLKQQVQELRIQIDAAKNAREVSAITETDYFRDLQAKAQSLRAKIQE